MVVGDFAYEYLCRPILDYSGYNLVNTFVYGIILLALAFLVVLPFLKKKGIKFDAKFGFALIPYIVIGSSFRILEDLHLLERSCNIFEFSFYTITPGIYFLTFAITFISLMVSHYIGTKFGKDYTKIFMAIGWAIAIPIVLFDFTQFIAADGFIIIVIATAIVVAAVVWGMERIKPGFFSDKLNIIALTGQALDGTATVVATNLYRCGEQHFVSEAIISINGPLFLVVKVALVLLILYYVDKEIKNENTKGFVKILIAILGLAPGIRDALTVGVGSCL